MQSPPSKAGFFYAQAFRLKTDKQSMIRLLLLLTKEKRISRTSAFNAHACSLRGSWTMRGIATTLNAIISDGFYRKLFDRKGNIKIPLPKWAANDLSGGGTVIFKRKSPDGKKILWKEDMGKYAVIKQPLKDSLLSIFRRKN